VSLVNVVEVPRRPVARLEPIVGGQRYAHLIQAADQVRRLLGGRTIWNVNSTATGGGVAEMLQVLVGYINDLDVPIGWLVLTGDARFFAATKRLHNQIHGDLAGGPLDAAEAHHYTRMLTANAVELLGWIRPGDVALLHDPQTADLAAPLARAGARVVWRCHIGVDWENDATRAGWDFLRPHLGSAEGYVFSRRQYVPAWLPDDKVSVIPPSIDPFSPKNQDLDPLPCKPSWPGSACSTAPRRRCPPGSCAATEARAPSPGRRSSPARAARAPMIRCWFRSPAGTGSRAWAESWPASPTTSCPVAAGT